MTSNVQHGDRVIDRAIVRELPVALAPWASMLSIFDADVALGLGPLLRRLDQAMGTSLGGARGQDEPDGYDGIHSRGGFDQLLVSEWLLATEQPDEFIRRVAMNELVYLRRARRAPHPPGRVLMLVDSGPDQLGARRLVQLAGMLVLARRAEAKGAELGLGRLGAAAGRWRTGALPDLVETWIRDRRSVYATADEVHAWSETIGPDDQLWVFTGPPLADRIERTSAMRVVNTSEGFWGDSGAVTLSVRVDAGALTLPLPSTDVVIRALRGEGLRRRPSVSVAPAHGPLRFPMFPSDARRLVARGESDDELVVFSVPRADGTAFARPKRFRMNGRVVAASVLGKRTVALVENDGVVTVDVRGSKLGRLDRISVPVSDFGVDGLDIDAVVSSGLAALYFRSGEVLVSLQGATWRLVPGERCATVPVVAIGPSRAMDRPICATRVRRDYIAIDGFRSGLIIGQTETSAAVVGAAEVFAWADESGVWRMTTKGAPGIWDDESALWGQRPSDETHAPIRLPPGELVRGVVADGDQHSLVAVSPGGQLVRLHGRFGSRTLTRVSGYVSVVAVHGVDPVVAVQHQDGSVTVLDISTNQVMLSIRPDRLPS